ncbi:uncharacterized protein METZ01_LOCUS370691, partial [marine metagenome]
IFEETAALTAIDVNSGRLVRDLPPDEHNLAINLEAAEEIGRQICLRNISGQILIDFLPQKRRSNREILRKAIKEAFVHDLRNTNLIGFTRLGLFELTRRRRNKSLGQQLFNTVDNLKSPLTVALEVLYNLKKEMIRNPGRLFVIETSHQISETLESGLAFEARKILADIMFSNIEVLVNPKYQYSEYAIKLRE